MSNKGAEAIVSQLLKERGIPLAEQAVFRNPDFERDTHSPWLLPGIEAAVSRLVKAQQKEESVLIFGDYDADGIPATALMIRALRLLGFEKVKGIIPSRSDGYGLTKAVAKELIKQKPDLLITIDNGTVAKDEIALIAKAGVSVIVIDHHEPQEGKVADKALAIVNPKMPASKYPFRELCACALGWKVTMALAEKLDIDQAPLKWLLDLVGLSTIADIVPLVCENRVLASFGLKVLRKTRNPGLKSLIAVSGVEQATVSAGDVGFKLAPRINAASRLHAEILNGEHGALTLLTTEDAEEAREIARHLNQQNSDRQQLVEAHLEEAERQVDAKAPILIAYHDSWSTGVVGLVASKLADRYKRPVMILAPEGKEIRGSVRSVDGVHALELLEAGSAELERFGGHAKAAGLTLKGGVEPLRTLLEGYMAELGLSLVELAAGAEQANDGELALADITLELAEALEGLEPFGAGFPTPVFKLESEAKGIRRVGNEGKHLSFFLSDGKLERKAIAFSYRGPDLEEGKSYRFFVMVRAEEWREVKSAVCHVRRVEVLDNAPKTS